MSDALKRVKLVWRTEWRQAPDWWTRRFGTDESARVLVVVSNCPNCGSEHVAWPKSRGIWNISLHTCPGCKAWISSPDFADDRKAGEILTEAATLAFRLPRTEEDKAEGIVAVVGTCPCCSEPLEHKSAEYEIHSPWVKCSRCWTGIRLPEDMCNLLYINRIVRQTVRKELREERGVEDLGLEEWSAELVGRAGGISGQKGRLFRDCPNPDCPEEIGSSRMTSAWRWNWLVCQKCGTSSQVPEEIKNELHESIKAANEEYERNLRRAR